MKRYLDLGVIHPGDIVLSAGQTMKSMAIRMATGSSVASHAALAIHPLIWFEAVGSGVRYLVIKPNLVWDGAQLRIGMEIPKGESYQVLRLADWNCNAADPAARHSVAKSLIAASSRFAFLNYAQPEDFLAALSFGLGKSALARFVANYLDQGRKKFFRGPFCSWLVAECYRELKIDLFDKDSNSITPAALARTKKLQALDAVFLGVAIASVPRFANLQRDLRIAVALTTTNLSTSDQGAVLAKVTTLLNDQIARVVARGWHLEGLPLPDESQGVFKAIEDKEAASFREWQASVIEALELAYPSLAFHTERFANVPRCHGQCANVLPDGTECGQNGFGDCRVLNYDVSRILGEIHSVFPRPTIPDDF